MRFNRRMVVVSTLLWLCSLLASGSSFANDAQELFSSYKDRLYQVRVIERVSGNKASYGSGFQISRDGILATNYHVVSEVVLKPEQ